MSLQRNLLIGAGALGAVMIISNVVSAETPENNENDKEWIAGTKDPSYLSVVNPYGINPKTGNTFCEDYENCPDDGFGEVEKRKEDDSSVIKDDEGRIDVDKTLKKQSKTWYRKYTLPGIIGGKTQEGADFERKVKKGAKKTGKAIKENKDVVLGVGLGALAPLGPLGIVAGGALGSKKGRKTLKSASKKAKKGWKKLKFWSAEETNPNINSSQSFMSDFF